MWSAYPTRTIRRGYQISNSTWRKESPELVRYFLLTEDPGIAHEHGRILPHPEHSLAYMTMFHVIT